jgi:ABC-type Fe3+ transport system permease subunit
MNKNTQKNLWIGLAILVVLAPLGLLAEGTAFGEWGPEELQKEVGYVPSGIEAGGNLWHSLFPDYTVSGFEGSFLQSAIGYILSAIIGVGLIYLITIGLGKLIARKEDERRNENT